MSIPDFSTEKGLSSLNNFLESRSYIEGYSASQSDVVVYDAVKSASADISAYGHVIRWYKHIESVSGKNSKLPGTKKAIQELGIIDCSSNSTDVTPAKQEDEDIDLFGSDDEEDAAAEALKAERLAAYHAKKATKPALIAKSSLLIDIKPWDDETDMKTMEEKVRSIEMDGLLWGTSKLVAIGYGIKKLQIAAVIEDAKVSVDGIEELVLAFEDLVQSMDVAAFNKI